MTDGPPTRDYDSIGERYRVEKELGHGGMATVYLCTDVTSGEQVAVKVLRPELGSIVTKERFFREIAFTSEFAHPSIPRVIDSGTTDDGIPFYAMDFVRGQSLRERFRFHERFTLEEIARITTAIAEPTSYAHARGIVHRDIKPENILIDGDRVFVLDFGVAKAIIRSAGERLTRSGITVGTPAYMSPEQSRGDPDVDYRSDIYSLGCVVYEMIAGTPPFQGATPQLLMANRMSAQPRPLRYFRDGMPEAVEQVVSKAMARFPESRWESVEEFAAALKHAVETRSDAENVEPDLLDRLRNIFAETYRVEEEMKGGGMSRLFLATDIALNRRVVIKILPPDLVSPMMLARFKRESEVTARLQHPHVLPVISAGVRDGLVHYVMPFIDGESLRVRLEREKRLPIADAIRILRETTDALAYAHRQGIIHRDIKPENILIQDGHAVLADFGIASALSESDSESGARLTGTGMSLGTVGYMAPEQALGGRNVDGRADIYAVGVVGYEMFAGNPPFAGATDQEILIAHLTREAPRVDTLRPDTPEPAAEAIRRAMAKDPESRFQTAAEFRDALEVSSGSTPRTIETAAAASPPSSRNRKLWAMPVAAVALISIAIYVSSRIRGAAQPQEIVTVAIAPFNAPTSELALWREAMVDVLARNLDGAGPLRTISPTIAIRGYPSVSDRASATALAQRTNAQYAIFGNLIGSSKDSVRFRASLIDIKKDKVVDFEGRDSTVEAAASALTRWALSVLGESHRIGAVRQSSFGSSSIDAMRAFLQGEQFFRRTSWDSASVAYTRAIGFDSTFAIALRRAAQVIGWQRSGSDSVATALRLRAGRANHGLSPRDSLLLVADSISASLASMAVDTLDWKKARRLFASVNEAAARYPDDPEVWYAVGEARFHHGFGSPVNVTERETLDAFDRSIALDSAFAPAYVHAIDLGFTLKGAEAGRRYTRAYLKLNPTDEEAEGIALVDAVAGSRDPGIVAGNDILDEASSDALMAGWYLIRRWPDSSGTAIKLLNSLARRSRSSPTYAADSLRLWNFMPLELAYRGRLSESYLALGKRPWRLFVELALLGGIPADTATQTMRQWVTDSIPQAYFALPWLAKIRDTQSIQALVNRAAVEQRSGNKVTQRSARYKSLSTRAYLALARGDTASAANQFAALPDTLCIACYIDRVTAARLLAAKGKDADALELLDQRLNTLITPIEILIAFERAPLEIKADRQRDAYESYKRVVDTWSDGDPALQPYVATAKREMSRLTPRITFR